MPLDLECGERNLAIASMTGFARAEGSSGSWLWNWEVKSVNSKGLDVRCRLPQGAEQFEVEVRNRAAKQFKRGNVNVTLDVSTQGDETGHRINRALLRDLVEAVQELAPEAKGFEAPRLDGLIAARGVVEAADDNRREFLVGDTKTSILKSLIQALNSLKDARGEEGERIGAVLVEKLEEIAALTEAASKNAALQPAQALEKFRAQLAELLDGGPSLPEERIAQEVAILVTKMDVQEEIDRLRAHVEAAGKLLSDGGVIGRQLDFLCQEINREANTLCSKAADVDLTRIGLDLKSAIEQFREQVQNIE